MKQGCAGIKGLRGGRFDIARSNNIGVRVIACASSKQSDKNCEKDWEDCFDSSPMTLFIDDSFLSIIPNETVSKLF